MPEQRALTVPMTFRLAKTDVDKIDALAQRFGTTRSTATCVAHKKPEMIFTVTTADDLQTPLLRTVLDD